MKKKSLQLACSLALAVSMVTQAIYPSAALIADTIETDPDVEITSESSYETSETSEESYPVDVSEPSASTDYTYVEETADLDETEANDPSSDETDAISSATDPDPTAETTDETVIETEETEETEETIEEEESTVEIIEASDMDAFLDEVTALPSSYRVIVSTTIDISDSIENVVGVYYDGLYILSFEDEASYSAAISFFSNCGISYCQDGTVEVNGVADYFHPISNAEINANGTVRVAIIDTGSNLANESYSVIGDYTGDDNGHGTRMAQLVLDNDTDNAYIISIKALGSDGHGSIVDVYNAVQLALDLGADYILMSFSTLNSTEYTAFKDLLSFANSVGATVVASAGNNGMNAAFYVPACASGVTTVGALNDDFTKQNTSNYGPCVNYYVVADSTSDAAALYVGYSLAGNSGNIYTTYLSESASLSDSELYDLYSDIANEITNELIAEYGYGECRLEINENGEFVFVYVFEGSASSDVVINARPDSELVNYATTDIGASPVTITDGMSGTDSGTAVYSQGSYPGWGSISSISSSGTTGSGLRLTQFASTMAVCCSRAFGGENSRYGLFSDIGKAVNLKQVSDELKNFDGNVWTVIISLRREDAKRLGFENAKRWQTFLASHTDEIADHFNIPLSDLKWYAAFHNESHHPHVHMIIYSDNESIRLTQYGINKLRSIFVNDVFQDEMYYLETKDTDNRNRLKKRSKEELDAIYKLITDRPEDMSELQTMMIELSHMLNEIDRKVVYGNAPKRIKTKVNLIVEKMAENPVIASLYDEWYNARDEITSYYQTEKNRRVPLSSNETFKSIRNDVIRCAYKISEFSEDEQWDEDVVNIPRLDDHYEETPIQRKTVDQFIASQVAHLIAGLGQMIADQTAVNDGTDAMRRKVDRKLRRKINEKKQSQGMRM